MSEIDWSKLSMVALWRDWIVKSEAQWSESLSRMLKDERAAPLLARQVDEARQMQRMFAEMAQASLASVNLPSRTDFEALDERMGRVEDALARLASELSQLNTTLAAAGVPAARPRPARDRVVAAKPADGT